MKSPELEPGETHSEWQPDLYLPDDYAVFGTLGGEVMRPIHEVFTIPSQSEDILGSQETFWFKPDFINQLGPNTNYVSACSFEERPEWRETRRNSRRQAFFGELTLDFGIDGKTVLPVACKHFYGAPEEGLHEYLASEYINELGFIKTFEPIGLWFDANGTAFLLTHFEKDVISLDNVDWRRNPDNSIREHFDIFAALERAAYSGAEYVANDLAHRDLLAKNVGFDQQTGAIRAIDLEQLRIVQSPEEPNLSLLHDYAREDLLAFVSSIHEAGFRWGEDVELRSQVLRSTFLSNFRSTLRHPSNKGVQTYGPEFTDMVEELCSYVEQLSEEEIETHWEKLVAAAEQSN